MLERSHRATLVLGLLVAVLMPVCLAATLSSSITWYHGLGLFYAALGIAEIGYLMLLLVLQGSRGPAFLKAIS